MTAPTSRQWSVNDFADAFTITVYQRCRHNLYNEFVARLETEGPASVTAALAAGDRAGKLCLASPNRLDVFLHAVDGEFNLVEAFCICQQGFLPWWGRFLDLIPFQADCFPCAKESLR